MSRTVAEPRGGSEGMLRILRYNRPFYVTAGVLCIVAAGTLLALRLPGAVVAAIWIAVLLAAGWSVASLLVSHWVYDRSDFARWEWLAGCFESSPRRFAILHAGLEETHGAIRRSFPGTAIELDFYAEGVTTEPSLARARRLDGARLGGRALRTDPGALPVASATLDAAFLVFAAHELREPAARDALLAESARALRPGGRIVLVEHLRDLANFLAFGPGFLHFHRRRSWLETARRAGLAVVEERRITPFVAVFVLEARP